TPVLLGGAALTRRFVEQDLRELYKGYVFYGEDAFTGLRIMDELTNPAIEKKLTLYEVRGGSGQTLKPSPPTPLPPATTTPPPSATTTRGASANDSVADGVGGFVQVKRERQIPKAPFWGSRVARGIALKDVFPYINETALLKVRWGFTRGQTSANDYAKLFKE